jgi:hypothetical protein
MSRPARTAIADQRGNLADAGCERPVSVSPTD